jgi:hypothetical protein
MEMTFTTERFAVQNGAAQHWIGLTLVGCFLLCNGCITLTVVLACFGKLILAGVAALLVVFFAVGTVLANKLAARYRSITQR